MPKSLYGHSSLYQGKNLYIVGGCSRSGCSSSIYKLTCMSGQFTWEEMDMKLQIAREDFVADFIPN